ncbi:MAG: hypothetical protein LBC98_02635 [Prevotellaceae bacterium]|jgi:hypothetical protein|nr:hypothetical protein [Prevotellaceae bacterium]
MKRFLLVYLAVIVFHSQSTAQFVNVSLGVPISQRIEQNGVSHKAKSYPNLDFTGTGFVGGGTGWFGWGVSINPYFLDISNLSDRNPESSKRFFCGLYTGPAVAIGRSKYCKPVMNLQIGYTFTNLFTSKPVSCGDFGAKASLDLVIYEHFSVGFACRPFDLKIEDARDDSSVAAYTLKPSFEIRLGYVW